MAFIPNTDEDRKEMLARIGVSSFDELIKDIPEEVRLKGKLDLPPSLSEYEVVKLLDNYARMNKTAADYVSYMGGGSYDHFIPTMVESVLERPEFKTAYTPYQAEVSQGTLQVMYEFQSMITELTGMDIANASLYDGGSALGEACFMANAKNKKTRFLIAGTINPHHKKVINSITVGKNYTFEEFIAEDGTCDIAALGKAMNDDVAGVIVQQPNAYGNLEDVFEIEKIAHSNKALYIASVNPLSLGILKPPSEYNADVCVGEAQPLGIPMNYGGPYLGIFACKKDFIRIIPGRIVGVTVDTDGNRGFVLTLQTREQQIKREKATSNICTNQGLFMLAATVYMATMGRKGIREVAENCLHNAHYLATQIQGLQGYKLLSDKPFWNEFLVIPPVSPENIIAECENKGILAGIDTSRYEDCKQGLLVAVTEKRTKKEIDDFVAILKQFP